MRQHRLGLSSSKRLISLPKLGVFVSENGGGKQSSVDRSRLANAERSHRHPARHLHDAEQRVHSIEGFGLDGNAEDGQGGLAGAHARKMGRTSGTGDDDFEAPGGSSGCILEQEIRCPVRTDDAGFKGHTKRFQLFCSVLEGFPIALGAHDDTDPGLVHAEQVKSGNRFPFKPASRGGFTNGCGRGPGQGKLSGP